MRAEHKNVVKYELHPSKAVNEGAKRVQIGYVMGFRI